MNFKKAFTLVELLVVVSIISLISSVVLSSLNTARSKARDAERILELQQLQKAMELYRSDFGTYPTNDGNTHARSIPSCRGLDGTSLDWSGAISLGKLVPTYITSLPIDPTNTTNFCYTYTRTEHSNEISNITGWYCQSGADIIDPDGFNGATTTNKKRGYVITFSTENNYDNRFYKWNNQSTKNYCLLGPEI